MLAASAFLFSFLSPSSLDILHHDKELIVVYLAVVVDIRFLNQVLPELVILRRVAFILAEHVLKFHVTD